MNLLHIDSSISGGPSASRQLSSQAVSTLGQAVPGLAVVRRDLELHPLPHLDSKMLAASWPENTVDAQTRDEVAKNAAVLDEFLAAVVVVIGAPMYNFAIPSQLKAWIDRIVIAGKTFRYTQTGPDGLAKGKKVIVASSRGGQYGPDTPQAAFDFQETYLRTIFAFIGIGDVEFVRAEGIAIGPEQREEAILSGLSAARDAALKIANTLNAARPTKGTQSQRAACPPAPPRIGPECASPFPAHFGLMPFDMERLASLPEPSRAP